MNIRELIAAMKSDKLQPDMIIEAFELLANQSPPAADPPAAKRVDPVALDVMQLKIEAAEVKIESMEIRLAALEAAPAAEPPKDGQANKDLKAGTEAAPRPRPEPQRRKTKR